MIEMVMRIDEIADGKILDLANELAVKRMRSGWVRLRINDNKSNFRDNDCRIPIDHRIRSGNRRVYMPGNTLDLEQLFRRRRFVSQAHMPSGAQQEKSTPFEK
jgi:hypothetical protein